jgi:hypothetical protein
MSGGFNKWKDQDRPWAAPQTLTPAQRNRYQRHLLLPEVGEVGQLQLLNSKVLLLGAGGLGSPAALYLAAAGVGTLGVIDMDVVDESNLQRQILHNMDRVGERKVRSLQRPVLPLPDPRAATGRARAVLLGGGRAGRAARDRGLDPGHRDHQDVAQAR